MGIFDNFKKALSVEPTDNEPVRISGSDLENYRNSVEGRISLIEAELFKIEFVYPEGANEIRSRIEKIRENAEKRGTQAEVQNQVAELENIFLEYEKKANQRYSIKEVEKAILRIKAVSKLDVERTEKLENEEEYVASVANRISDFEGQERDKLIGMLMQARYHIKICKMIIQFGNENEDYKLAFAGVPEVEKVYYGNLLRNDINELVEENDSYYKRVKDIEEKMRGLKGDQIIYTSIALRTYIGIRIDRLQEKFMEALTKDFGVTGLFNNYEFLSEFANIKTNLVILPKRIQSDEIELEELAKQREQETREKQEEEKRQEAIREQEARKEQEEKERQEKYKNMTEQELEQVINQISSQEFDMKEKYKKIVKAQLNFARAKGIITQKEELKNDGIDYILCMTSEIPAILQNAKEQNIYCTALLEVDDDDKTSVVCVAENDKEKVSKIDTQGIRTSGEERKIGELPNEVLSFIPKEFRSALVKRYIKNKGTYEIYEFFTNGEVRNKPMMQKVYEDIKKMDESSENIKDIKFSIQLPLTRSMIPIIQKLKEEGIEFYIPPTEIPGFEYKKKEPTYCIYIDRQYLELYKQKVHSAISGQNGIVVIQNEDVKLSELLLDGVDFPYGIGKQKHNEERLE